MSDLLIEMKTDPQSSLPREREGLLKHFLTEGFDSRWARALVILLLDLMIIVTVILALDRSSSGIPYAIHKDNQVCWSFSVVREAGTEAQENGRRLQLNILPRETASSSHPLTARFRIEKDGRVIWEKEKSLTLSSEKTGTRGLLINCSWDGRDAKARTLKAGRYTAAAEVFPAPGNSAPLTVEFDWDPDEKTNEGPR